MQCISQKMAARLGVEPRQNESESFVLPIHHRAVKNLSQPAGNAAHFRQGFGGHPSVSELKVRWKAQVQRLAVPSAAHRAKDGAGDGIRTRNRLFTKQVLYH